MAENPLTKLPLLGQLAVSVVVATLIGGAFWYFYWDEAVQTEKKKADELSTLNKEIQLLEVTKNKLEDFRREVDQRKTKLDLLKRILPVDKETPELMKKVQYLATQSNLGIKKFNPSPTVTKSFEQAPPKPAAGQAGPAQAQDSYQEWPISVDLEGNYHNLGQFLYRVSRLSRLVNIGSIKIKSQGTPKPMNTITVSCVATTYVYVEAPRPAAAKAGAAPPRP